MKRAPSIFNWQISPPAGGWNVKYVPPEMPSRIVLAQGHLHTEVVDFIVNWRRNNNLPPNEDEVFEFCDREWCRRDPLKCTNKEYPEPQPAGTGRRTLTPVDYGPSCWGFLATFGVNFVAELWNAAIKQVQMMLNPANPHNNGAGCESCAAHFAEFCYKMPPHRVRSADEAAVFVWLAHNEANRHALKPRSPTFRQAAAQHGWSMLSDAEIEEIRTRLSAPEN